MWGTSHFEVAVNKPTGRCQIVYPIFLPLPSKVQHPDLPSELCLCLDQSDWGGTWPQHSSQSSHHWHAGRGRGLTSWCGIKTSYFLFPGARGELTLTTLFHGQQNRGKYRPHPHSNHTQAHVSSSPRSQYVSCARSYPPTIISQQC